MIQNKTFFSRFSFLFFFLSNTIELLMDDKMQSYFFFFPSFILRGFFPIPYFIKNEEKN